MSNIDEKKYAIDWMSVGERLKSLRKSSGVQQGKLAEELNVVQSKISKLEHGLGWNWNIFEAICKYFNVAADWLLGRSYMQRVFEADSKGTYEQMLSCIYTMLSYGMLQSTRNYETAVFPLDGSEDAELITHEIVDDPKVKELLGFYPDDPDDYLLDTEVFFPNDHVLDRFLQELLIIVQLKDPAVQEYWLKRYMKMCRENYFLDKSWLNHFRKLQ